jgi:hypothetical protein
MQTVIIQLNELDLVVSAVVLAALSLSSFEKFLDKKFSIIIPVITVVNATNANIKKSIWTFPTLQQSCHQF